VPNTRPSALIAPSARAPSRQANCRARPGGFAHVHLVPLERRAQRHAAHAPQRLFRGEHGFHVQQAQPGDFARIAFDPQRIGDPAAKHLVSAANPQHRAAAPVMGEDVDVPALRAQERHVGNRRFRSRQHDQRGMGGDRRAGRNHRHLHLRLLPQGIEIVEIGDARQDRAGDQLAPRRDRGRAVEHHRILAGQPGGHRSRAPARSRASPSAR
jgi:hypothetical protein